jgi:hypothetical protein
MRTLLLALPVLALAACGGATEPVTASGSSGSTPPPTPTVSLAASPNSVTSNGSSTLTWSSTDASSCVASGAWSGSLAASGSQSSGALTATSSYSITCTGLGGSATASATVTVSGSPPPPPAPTVSLTANPTSVAGGAASTLTWSSTNAASCISSGAWGTAPKALSGSQSTGALTASGSYSLTCTGSGGSASASATVTVFPVPTVSLMANPTMVTSGGSSMLTWSSTNATSCLASGAWSGTKATSNSTGQSTGPLTNTSAFTLACTGTGGTASASATVTVTTGTPTYSTNFPLTETPISENGAWHRSSGNVFTDVSTANGIAFGTNGARDTYDDSYALLSGFGADQTAEAVVFRSPSLVSNDMITHEVELLLRFADTATTARGYECTFNYLGDVLGARWNGTLGDFTPLSISGGAGNLGRDLMTGDVIKCTIVGNTISFYINGVLMGKATDSTFASGQPGIGFFTRPAGVSDNPNFGLTSYTVTSN